MNPPVKTSIQAKPFKGLFDARVPPKRNESFKKVHPDFHYASSQISLVNQLGVLFDENTLSLSVDNKNKVEVGIPATSRRSKINKFYLKEFSPNYFDHDFPHVDAKLVPAGYQILKHRPRRSRSLSPVKKVYINRKRSNSLDSLSINRLFLILSTL